MGLITIEGGPTEQAWVVQSSGFVFVQPRLHPLGIACRNRTRYPSRSREASLSGVYVGGGDLLKRTIASLEGFER